MAQEHKCGTCNGVFASELDYLNHKCTTGFTPTQPDHLGEVFKAISKEAVKRGEERKVKTKIEEKAKV